MTSALDSGVGRRARRDTPHQRAWYWYDWANSAYVTTTMTVLIGPYLTAVAKGAACPGLADAASCRTDLHVLGLPVSPGSLAPYTLTVSTLVSAVLLIFVGAVADRSPRPTRLFAAFAWAGALAGSLLFLVAGSSWQLGVVLLIVANLCLGSSLVIYDSLLCRIAAADERDRVSSRGWALGYAGGGLLLALNFVLLNVHASLGLSQGMAVRVSLLSAGLWWGVFTLIPVLGLRDVHGTTATPVEKEAGVVGGSVRQLARTFAELRRYPQTLLFLLAYLFFNDGIQTVIGSSSLYGIEELKFSQSTVLGVFLLVQFIAFGGALLFGRLARSYGAWRVVLTSLGVWTFVVTIAFFVPAKALGAFVFGLVHQLTDSYRWAIVALIVFFVLGGALLSRVRMAEGIRAAGNELPAVV